MPGLLAPTPSPPLPLSPSPPPPLHLPAYTRARYCSCLRQASRTLPFPPPRALSVACAFVSGWSWCASGVCCLVSSVLGCGLEPERRFGCCASGARGARAPGALCCDSMVDRGKTVRGTAVTRSNGVWGFFWARPALVWCGCEGGLLILARVICVSRRDCSVRYMFSGGHGALAT